MIPKSNHAIPQYLEIFSPLQVVRDLLGMLATIELEVLVIAGEKPTAYKTSTSNATRRPLPSGYPQNRCFNRFPGPSSITYRFKNFCLKNRSQGCHRRVTHVPEHLLPLTPVYTLPEGEGVNPPCLEISNP